jgi:hypothetical protein
MFGRVYSGSFLSNARKVIVTIVSIFIRVRVTDSLTSINCFPIEAQCRRAASNAFSLADDAELIPSAVAETVNVSFPTSKTLLDVTQPDISRTSSTKILGRCVVIGARIFGNCGSRGASRTEPED